VTKEDGSNCPFTITSFTSLKRLTDTVSQKLGCYPGSLKLRYRLDTDKPKTPATSIQSVDELKIFKDRLRLLIVPQCLSNGKLSSRVLKPVTVCFENGSNTDQSSAHTNQSNSRHSTTSGEKQVCDSIYVYFSFVESATGRKRGHRQSSQVPWELAPARHPILTQYLIIPRCRRRQRLPTCSNAGSASSTLRPRIHFAGSHHNPIASAMSSLLRTLGYGQWK
jgi:hypothetical protein